eukprot:gene7689-9001_t
MVPVLIVLATSAGYLLRPSKDSKKQNKQAAVDATPVPKTKKEVVATSEKEPSKKRNNNQSNSHHNVHVPAPAFAHPLLVKTVKAMGATPEIRGISLSPDGKFMAYCSVDRVIKMFNFPSCFDKPTSFNIQLPFDSASSIAWSDKTIYATLQDTQKVIAYSILDQKNQEGKSYQKLWETPMNHKHNIKTMCARPLASYLLTCGDDTIVNLWSSKGQFLTSVNTGQMRNYMASMSGNARYFAVAAFNSEVKIWEVLNKKDGSFDKCVKVMSLTGYKTSIYGVSFSSDGTKVVTTSKDGSIKCWGLEVRYNVGQDPDLLYTINNSDLTPVPTTIQIAPDSSLFSVGNGQTIQFRSLATGAIVDTIPAPSEYEFTDNTVCWTADSKNFVSAGNGLIHIWKSPKK